MQMNGELSNFFAYTFGNGTLKGILNFTSSMIDANEFLTPEETARATHHNDTTSITAPEIPDNIDFTLNANISKLLYTNMDIKVYRTN
jgi:hypothetical protein